MIAVSKILVPVDFSLGSKLVVEYAVALAQTLKASVTLLHVRELPGSMSSIVPGSDNARDGEKAHAFAQERLDLLCAETRKHTDVEMRTLVHQGSPIQEIIALGRSGTFDMVVMGTHGRTGLQQVLMGSVAEAVVRRGTFPVLTIHLPAVSSRA